MLGRDMVKMLSMGLSLTDAAGNDSRNEDGYRDVRKFAEMTPFNPDACRRF